MKNKDIDNFIREKAKEDQKISKGAEDVIKKFEKNVVLEGGEQMEKRVVTISFGKFVTIAASLVIVGFLGINLYAPFLAANKEAELEDVLRHIYHMLSIMGEDGIALGSDFDGIDSAPKEITNVQDVALIFDRVEKEFGKRVSQKFSSENLLRVIKQVL